LHHGTGEIKIKEENQSQPVQTREEHLHKHGDNQACAVQEKLHKKQPVLQCCYKRIKENFWRVVSVSNKFSLFQKWHCGIGKIKNKRENQQQLTCLKKSKNDCASRETINL